METLSVNYIPVTQPVGTFYVTSISVEVLLCLVDILNRNMTEEGQNRVQREYNETRGKEIAKYVSEDNATFPTSIIIASYPDQIRFDENEKTLLFGKTCEDGTWQPMEKSNLFKIGEVIDGQHRLLGLRRAIDEGRQELKSFELPVVFMLDLNQGYKAYIFSIINSKQRSVSSSLIMDLFGLHEGRSPYKTCHEIAQAFYDWEDELPDGSKKQGPFYRGLKMLGKKVHDGEMLSQGSFCKYILRLISRNPDEDSRAFTRNGEEAQLPDDPRCRLRYLFIQGKEKDPVIARILHEYFLAIMNEFQNEWSIDPEKYLLRKTVGFSALIQVFEAIWDRTLITNPFIAANFFKEKAEEFRRNLAGSSLTSEIFPSSERGASTIAKKMLGTGQ